MKDVRSFFEKKYAECKTLKEQVSFLMRFSMNYGDFMPQFCLELADQLETISGGTSEEDLGRAYAKLCRSFSYSNLGRYQESSRELEEASVMLENLGDRPGILMGLSFRGFEAVSLGRIDVALEYGFRAMKLVEQWGDEPEYYSRVWLNYAMGVYYFNQNEYDKSIQYYSEGLRIAKVNQDIYAEARCLSGLGSCFSAKALYDKASEHILRSIPLFEQCMQVMGHSRALNDLGVVERELGRLDSARDYLGQSLELRRSMNYIPGLTSTLLELGALHIATGQFHDALASLTEALEFSEAARAKPKIAQAHRLLSVVYRHLEDPWKALEHYEKFFDVKNQISGTEAANRLKQIETRFATERSEKEAEIHRLKNVELRAAYDVIETKNREILDSITYARRLQQAILPSSKRFSELLPGAFVLYQPRDIVSGDFYWLETINGKILFAAVDCTGHGVPGAFVSIVGANGLNRCVHEFGLTDPGEILTRLSGLVTETFSHSGEQVNDGMDIALCCFDPETKQLRYAGAFNDLLLVRGEHLAEFKADKYPIGNQFGFRQYRTEELILEKGDQVFIYTDGYADQFGGPKGKKFKKKNLHQKLVSIAALDPGAQKHSLEQTLADWRGELEQVDDVLVIGVKF